jgi:uncharacterized protein YjbJ (UPF0337 family)
MAWKAGKVAGCVTGNRRLNVQGRPGRARANIVRAAGKVKDTFKG